MEDEGAGADDVDGEDGEAEVAVVVAVEAVDEVDDDEQDESDGSSRDNVQRDVVEGGGRAGTGANGWTLRVSNNRGCPSISSPSSTHTDDAVDRRLLVVHPPSRSSTR